MLKVGITGNKGFIGAHLVNTIKIRYPNMHLVPFEKSFFQNADMLDQFVAACDVIVHLAAKNRDTDPSVVYNTNLSLSRKLLDALERTGSKPYIIFSSSTQELLDNQYGESKRESRSILCQWAETAGVGFAGLIIPNVFGPFCKPFYNSFIATFCHQLITGDEPVIITDNDVSLIYIDELIEIIIEQILLRNGQQEHKVKHTNTVSVTKVLLMLKHFRNSYFINGVIPDLAESFEKQLFHTFVSYFDYASRYPIHYKQHEDERGFFSELMRADISGQVSFSTTHPGITRGNHFHTRKIERFSVIKGEAIIKLRRYNDDKILSFHLSGTTPSYVDMPIWYLHNITNVGADELYTVFWINEPYNASDPDTFFENIEQ